MTTTNARLFSVAALVLTGCIGVSESPEGSEAEVGIARSELLSMNALDVNGLNMNGLNMNGLSSANLAAIQAPTTNGDLARQLLKYMLSCAFDETQSFSFTWIDASGVAHNDTYWGLLGLATGWATKALNSSDEGWVTSCLLSRTNWYGASVSISARGPTGTLHTYDPGELANYTYEEGAFWGNLFATTPVAYSCDNTPNDAHSRAQQRDCATGHLDASNNLVDCGILHHLGSCSTYCDPLNTQGIYRPKCHDSAGTTTNTVLTIFLQ
jgi:hypothetical protein